MLFVHGFGCDQSMWRFVTPAFEANYEIILVDLTGMGQSESTQYDSSRYATLQSHARDLLEVLDALRARNVVFVGHSVSATIGALAAIARPELFDSLVMVAPNPCYINDGDYTGGFERADIEAMLATLDSNYLGWSSAMAPVIMGNPEKPELGAELTNSFCRTDPLIAQHFARVTFLSDHRRDLPRLAIPVLILQCSEDSIAPQAVGDFVHAAIRNSSLVQLQATGHCPNLSAPQETVAAMRAFLESP